jgi:hypothetical protein
MREPSEQHRALVRDIARRLLCAEYDIVRVVDFIFTRTQGAAREKYGDLSLATDARDFKREAQEEHADGAVYHACDAIRRLDRERAELHEAARLEIARLPVLRVNLEDVRREFGLGSELVASIEGRIAIPFDDIAPNTFAPRVAEQSDPVVPLSSGSESFPDAPLTWTCRACKLVHPIDHEGMFCGICLDMVACVGCKHATCAEGSC